MLTVNVSLSVVVLAAFTVSSSAAEQHEVTEQIVNTACYCVSLVGTSESRLLAH